MEWDNGLTASEGKQHRVFICRWQDSIQKTHKDSTKIHLQLIKYICKINKKKSVSLRTNSKHIEEKKKKPEITTPFTIASKIPWNWSEEAKDFYYKNLRHWRKENWRSTRKYQPCSWIGRRNSGNSCLAKSKPQTQCHTNQSPNNTLMEIEKRNLKFIWNLKGFQIAKTVLKK